MRARFNLKEVLIPENKHIPERFHNHPKNNIFMSEKFLNPDPAINKDKRALVLIQGTGAVRAGIWARSACINLSFEKGSMLPFLKEAEREGVAVLVMNPNLHSIDGKTI